MIDLYANPYADFTWTPAYPLANQTATFNASASKPNGIVIVAYSWNFGDGTPITQTMVQATTHRFTIGGTYTVSLTIRNNAGFNGTTSKLVVAVSAPKTEFIWSPPQSYAFDQIVFDASSSSPNGGTIVTYTWNFGDGNTTSTTAPTTTHTYFSSAIFTVTLNVTNSYTFSNVTSKTINISQPQDPIAAFTHTPFSPGIHEQITLNATSSIARGGFIVYYVWSFDDGIIENTTSPLIYHAFQTDGNHSITLNVTNTAGYGNTTTKSLLVIPVSGPNANYTLVPLNPVYNQTVKLDASASTPGWNGTTHPPIVYYTWSFGDGNTTSTTSPIIYHVYTTPGNCTAALTATDSDGRAGLMTKVVTVTRLIGDLNGDGKVDMKDIAIVAKVFSTQHGDPNWNPIADLNGDGKVDMKDIAIVAKRFGQSL
jgi:PKD repeat protein